MHHDASANIAHRGLSLRVTSDRLSLQNPRAAGCRPDRQRGGVEGGWLLRHASGSPACLPVGADRAAGKHLGGSRNCGEAGLSADPARGSDGRPPRDARLWRIRGAPSISGKRPALRITRYFRLRRWRSMAERVARVVRPARFACVELLLGVVDQSAGFRRTPRRRGAAALSDGGQGNDPVVWLTHWLRAISCARRHPEHMHRDERFLAGGGPGLSAACIAGLGGGAGQDARSPASPRTRTSLRSATVGPAGRHCGPPAPAGHDATT